MIRALGILFPGGIILRARLLAEEFWSAFFTGLLPRRAMPAYFSRLPELPGVFLLPPAKKPLKIRIVRGRSAFGTMIWSFLKEEMGIERMLDSVRSDPIADR